MIEYHNKITALYSRLSVGDEDRDGARAKADKHSPLYRR
ncbi:hypothetical protein HMPREF9723_00598 [Treponema denticola OTK]|uniref:Resolvase/invertase-type recombinase catalytic domain-containing protein n=1 Tax=Treponema denticola OTK TaxID=999434 RepID=A0A0F6MR43_TREDN|nr:hypothetical protein HMPREF9723_00598 [Treponema denticola OTK]